MAAQYVMASTDRGETWQAISPDLHRCRRARRPRIRDRRARQRRGRAGGRRIDPVARALARRRRRDLGRHEQRAACRSRATRARPGRTCTPPNLPPGGINVIDASHANAGTAYVALLSRDGHPHIYRTDDFGQHWQEISTGLTDGEAVRVVREDPVDPNLLYAGTVTSAYVSFDRGDHWQSLQLNLPNDGRQRHDRERQRSRHLDLRPRLLDSGRRDAAAAGARGDGVDRAGVSLQARAGVARAMGQHAGHAAAAGDEGRRQPARGRGLRLLPRGAGDRARHADDQRRRPATSIREFSSVAPPADTTMANVPDYWLMPPLVLPTSAGMHRVAWDLRYPDPPTLNYGYYGNLLDYREYTLSWHALPGQTPRIDARRADGGAGHVHREADGGRPELHAAAHRRARSARAVSAGGARRAVPAAAAHGGRASRRRITACNYLEQLRAALTARTTDAADKPARPRSPRAIQALDAALAPLDERPGRLRAAHRDLGRRLNDQLVGDSQPTASIVAGVDAPCRAIDAGLTVLRGLQTSNIAELNAALTRAGVGTVPAWTPPAGPACGAAR